METLCRLALGQKAPCAKRRIKTFGFAVGGDPTCSQKAPSAKRCIKTAWESVFRVDHGVCQKAPSARRCIKTL